MIIAHISDTHLALPEPENSNRLTEFNQAIAEINALDPLPDLVVHTGDIVHWGTIEEYNTAHDVMSQLKMPFHVIPGNRDRRPVMADVFARQLAGSGNDPFFQYVIEDESARMIMLDTLDEENRLGKLCEARLGQFKSMLEADRQKQTIIFMHHPPFDVMAAPDPFQFDSRQTVARFSKIVKDHPQVRAIYCGHSHRRAADTINGIPVSVIPALAIDLRWGEYPESHRNRPVVEIYTW